MMMPSTLSIITDAFRGPGRAAAGDWLLGRRQRGRERCRQASTETTLSPESAGPGLGIDERERVLDGAGRVI
jgi:hypothetical protein